MARREHDAARALGRMRDGALLLFIAWVLLGVGLAMAASIALAVWAIVSPTPRVDLPEILTRRVVVGWAVIGLALVAVGAVVALVGLLAMFIPGVAELALARPELGTASALIKVGYPGGLVLLVVSALLAVARVWPLIPPLGLLGLVLLLLGHVGAIVLCFKLNEIYPSALYLIAGALMVVSIFIPVVAVVSWVLLYVALGDTMRRMRTSA